MYRPGAVRVVPFDDDRDAVLPVAEEEPERGRVADEPNPIASAERAREGHLRPFPRQAEHMTVPEFVVNQPSPLQTGHAFFVFAIAFYSSSGTRPTDRTPTLHIGHSAQIAFSTSRAVLPP
jgi:hypothetical protein